MGLCYAHLSDHERDVIAAQAAAGVSAAVIAAGLGRHPSTVRRELGRGTVQGAYLAHAAAGLARKRRTPSNGRPLLLAQPGAEVMLTALVDMMRRLRFSVEQALRTLRRGRDPILAQAAGVCRQTVYAWAYANRSPLARQLRAVMIRPRAARVPRSREERRGKLPDTTPITRRPAAAQQRSEVGHWEGDLLLGAGRRTTVITLVDRASRLTVVLPVPNRRSRQVTSRVEEWIEQMPPGTVRTLSWDQGKEMAEHARLTARTGVTVYFAAPHSPWQRPTNEHTNGVLRRHYPKGTPLPTDPGQLQATADALNNRPLHVLSWQTPLEAFTALTGHALQN